MKFKKGMLVSANPCNFGNIFMPGVGEIELIRQEGWMLTTVYDCEHNGKIYTYTEDQIYEYDPY